MDIINLANEFKRSGYSAELKYKNTVIAIHSWTGSFEILKSRSRDMYFVSRLMIFEWLSFCGIIIQILMQFYLPDFHLWFIVLLLLTSIWTFIRIVKGHFINKNLEQFLADRGILL
ncbi:hypothetical protein KDW99_01745 [Marinomonas rhizomae]|uniref:hypothetical protein n=1 Tax=Marinomonas rhizomae TaxID=491948 RepID=UPI002103B89B|nr:hypothetical protein [Marinomonas rhizomae]UTV99899.1 hypothetical protein KDW99_01745 [Marinomonas rhizomae]